MIFLFFVFLLAGRNTNFRFKEQNDVRPSNHTPNKANSSSNISKSQTIQNPQRLEYKPVKKNDTKTTQNSKKVESPKKVEYKPTKNANTKPKNSKSQSDKVKKQNASETKDKSRKLSKEEKKNEKDFVKSMNEKNNGHSSNAFFITMYIILGIIGGLIIISIIGFTLCGRTDVNA